MSFCHVRPIALIQRGPEDPGLYSTFVVPPLLYDGLDDENRHHRHRAVRGFKSSINTEYQGVDLQEGQLRKDRADHFTRDIGKSEVPAVVQIRQAFVV